MRESSAAPTLQLLLFPLALLAAGCGLELAANSWDPPPAAAIARELVPREPCAQHDRQRRAFFGDLHVHTGHSMDAQALGTTTTPDDAYRFARGEPIDVFAGVGQPPRVVRLGRPLDFTAVTDHAEWLGEVSLCITPGSPSYDSRGCRIFRGETRSVIARILGLEQSW